MTVYQPLQLSRLRAITLAVSSEAGVRVADLVGPSRLRRIAWPRQVAYLACREMTSASLPAIGRHFGRDHSTILHGIRAASARPETAALLEAVRALLSPIPAVPPAGCRVYAPPQDGAADSPERRASRSGGFSAADGAP